MAQITQKEIAESLGINRVTVTKALKGHPDISQNTIEKVRKLAEEKGYVPNILSRNLALKKTNMIGFVVPKLFNSFCASAIEAAHETALEEGFQIIPMITYEDPEIEKQAVKTLLSFNVDGIVIDITENTHDFSIFKWVKEKKVPLLFMDRFPEKEDFHRIITNDFEIAYEATTDLLKQGYQRIAYIDTHAHLNIGKHRYDGFAKAMGDAGQKINGGFIHKGAIAEKTGMDVLDHWVAQDLKPDALICSTLSSAIGAHKQARKHKIKIPEQLAIITFGEKEMAQLLTPSLSIYHVPVRKMATKATQMIIRKSRDKSYRIPKVVSYKAKLYQGESMKSEELKVKSYKL